MSSAGRGGFWFLQLSSVGRVRSPYARAAARRADSEPRRVRDPTSRCERDDVNRVDAARADRLRLEIRSYRRASVIGFVAVTTTLGSQARGAQTKLERFTFRPSLSSRWRLVSRPWAAGSPKPPGSSTPRLAADGPLSLDSAASRPRCRPE